MFRDTGGQEAAIRYDVEPDPDHRQGDDHSEEAGVHLGRAQAGTEPTGDIPQDVPRAAIGLRLLSGGGLSHSLFLSPCCSA